jgi:hypothetical protein
LQSINMPEGLNDELRRRTRVSAHPFFPNLAGWIRETHEGGLDHRYLNMARLREARKDQLRKPA